MNTVYIDNIYTSDLYTGRGETRALIGGGG